MTILKIGNWKINFNSTMLPSAYQMTCIAVPGLIFVSLVLMFLYKLVNICSGSSWVAEMRTTPRRTDMTHMGHMRTRATQTREVNMTPPDTVFL